MSETPTNLVSVSEDAQQPAPAALETATGLANLPDELLLLLAELLPIEDIYFLRVVSKRMCLVFSEALVARIRPMVEQGTEEEVVETIERIASSVSRRVRDTKADGRVLGALFALGGLDLADRLVLSYARRVRSWSGVFYDAERLGKVTAGLLNKKCGTDGAKHDGSVVRILDSIAWYVGKEQDSKALADFFASFADYTKLWKRRILLQTTASQVEGIRKIVRGDPDPEPSLGSWLRQSECLSALLNTFVGERFELVADWASRASSQIGDGGFCKPECVALIRTYYATLNSQPMPKACDLFLKQGLFCYRRGHKELMERRNAEQSLKQLIWERGYCALGRAIGTGLMEVINEPMMLENSDAIHLLSALAHAVKPCHYSMSLDSGASGARRITGLFFMHLGWDMSS